MVSATNRDRRNELRSNHWRRNVSPAVLERDNWICHICKHPIEYVIDETGKRRSRYKSPHPMSASIDHVVGAATGMDQRFLKAAHRGCNMRRGDPTRTGDPKPKVATRW